MTEYEELLNELEIEINEYPFRSAIKGICLDDTIGIRNDLTDTEKRCVLAEEVGHFNLTFGNILDQADTNNRKQELRARVWSYDKLLGIRSLIQAYEHGCRNRYEISEYLNVTESFLQDAVKHYRNKYGTEIVIEDYVICFEPILNIRRRFN